MMFKTAAAICSLLPSLALAQYGYNPPAGNSSPTTSSSAAAAAVPSAPANTDGHINVDVAAGGQFVFSPANITAPNNTVVTFFFPNAGITHSVTQSSFAAPCTYLAASSNNSAGFDSGLTAGTQFSITITDDTKPIWFHCKQITHCGIGMVGSINAPTTGNTHANFVAAAMAIGAAGEPTEADNGPTTGGFGALATAPPTSGTAAPTSGGSGGSGNGALQTGMSMAAVLAGVAAAVSFA
ncbi:hypothetical protein PLEOSDRAFT_1087897 [Pleurotus ostreatus PC15]|uniref:Blue (type 1) copper domain-containing protein n=1 Tax=Pleurotus ostreatus (strain PC15) TaxID=1137138 RepID=A0A067P0D3_PLEO1|nr:hypothetical protein PLEOSDRAFT_1087897 [Pleurotus ostreatus PC15]